MNLVAVAALQLQILSLIQGKTAGLFQRENSPKFFTRSHQMNPSESQYAAFKAITQQAQRLQRSNQTPEVRAVVDQIMAIARIQTNAIIDGNKVQTPPDNTPDSPMSRAKEAIIRPPSNKVSNIIWAVLAGLWILVSILGTQNFQAMFQ